MALQEPMLDFAPQERAGFRLQRVEVLNWGTFHERVWALTPNGDNSLLTGEIGSGKSTLVDAITTLLVPAQRITYNKAAGADARERSLRSYVLGYYKSERGDAGLATRPVPLRDGNNYSVILGHFYNEGYDQHVTLAQVFWMRDERRQPDRYYVIADRPLAIADHFADFGSDLKLLRKRLRTERQVEIHDTFPPFGAAFRRRFGIETEQALELFNQTVSMKSVGNLTEFVRTHMLEPFPVEDRIEALIQHFDDLDRAHAAVLKAKAQVAALEPLVGHVDSHEALSKSLDELRGCRDALRPWFAGLRSELLVQRIGRLDGEMERLGGRIQRLEAEKQAQVGRRDELVRAITEQGGARLEQLSRQIEEMEALQEKRRQRWDEYGALAEELGLEVAADPDLFLANRREVEQALNATGDEHAILQNRLTEVTVETQELQRRHDALSSELDSLRRRRSNLPSAMLALRERMCEETGLAAESLPFAGELLQVREGARDWEGAIERLLHGFGLSLLVPDEQYRAVAEWVDATQLRGRLVYFRVREQRRSRPQEPHAASLVRKLEIRSESPLFPWLEAELARRFDYACCAGLDEFRREQRAITRSGQIKGGGERHEKDDRHRIDDRTRYVLGWTNEAKVAALEKEAADFETRIGHATKRMDEARRGEKALREREAALNRIAVYRDFEDLDWRTATIEAGRLSSEREALEAGSDRLRVLRRQFDELEAGLKRTEEDLKTSVGDHATTEDKLKAAREALAESQDVRDSATEEARVRYFSRLETMRAEALGDQRLTVESCDSRQVEMRDAIQSQIDAEQKRLDRLRDTIIKAMEAYRQTWPLETREVDASLEAAPDFRAMLEALRADDLPRFEARFKVLLNENTIREVANFQAQLNKERGEIQERIATINRSLREVEYSPNRYIALLAEDAQDPEVRQFRQDLRACTEGALTGSGDEQYSENKFLQVKAIIERLRGREGLTDTDRRWTRKVSDVRNWFVFSASERWQEDDREHEHYTDSGGKSGGQKEKLAYTVLAASLAYQFGLEWGATRSRSFRFVVIDEAFGRGSDESARFGLELFKKLNLQLLIVTPLQKIHIIEPYVSNVGFVHSESGRLAMLRNLDIEEFRAEQAVRKQIRLDPVSIPSNLR